MTHTIIIEIAIAIVGTFFIVAPVLYLIVYGLPRWMVPRRWRRQAGSAVEFTPSDSGIVLVPVVPVADAGDLEAGNERAGKEQTKVMRGERNG